MARKVILVFLCAVLFTFGFTLSSTALTIYEKPTSRFFVNDFANVLDENTENTIYAAGVQLYEKTGAQVVVVTLNSIGGADIAEYGVELGRAWGIGNKDKDNGILLLLAMEERKINISVGYGLEGAVTDMQSGVILDHYAMPHFEDGNYAAGMAAAYDALINEVYLEYGMEADPNYVPVEQLDSGDSTVTWVSIIVLLLVVSLLMRRTRGGIFFFPIGGFHHHGGGFGGGGGGFRGGGGSFGGGGASRGF